MIVFDVEQLYMRYVRSACCASPSDCWPIFCRQLVLSNNPEYQCCKIMPVERKFQLPCIYPLDNQKKILKAM